MIFIYHNKEYHGQTAVRIIRAVERDAAGYPNKGGSIQDFLGWSVAQMTDLIPMRDLDVSPSLADETIAYNYLCLLDNFGIGSFYDTLSLQSSSTGDEKRSDDRKD